MIKKYKNGNIELKVEGEWETIDNFYHNDMFMSDLYFNQINGCMYLCDQNTRHIYDFSDCYGNILVYFGELLNSKSPTKLFPVSKKQAKQLWKDLENGF